MKAIIIAAGIGSRMKTLTSDRPKCMLEFDGKTLLQYQMDTLRRCGIDRIAVIKGYRKEKIDYHDLIYYVNDNYKNNNILHSLFYAKEEMSDEFIAIYSDIIYDKQVVGQLLNSKEDISIVVDVDWRAYYKDRADHSIDEAENVIFDSNNMLLKIGKRLSDKNEVHGEFIGMMRCTTKGAKIFREHFHNLKNLYPGRPFQKASVFEQAYLTDMLQDLVDSSISVNCVVIKGGWKEIDTIQDYERLIKRFLQS